MFALRGPAGLGGDFVGLIRSLVSSLIPALHSANGRRATGLLKNPMTGNSGHNAYQTFPPLESLGASLTLRIGKIAIERKADILHQGVDAKMIALGRLAALSHMVEGAI